MEIIVPAMAVAVAAVCMLALFIASEQDRKRARIKSQPKKTERLPAQDKAG